VTNDLLSLIRNETNEVESLSVSGGLARFDTINQIKADVTNLPVNVIENFESTAIGALIILRVSLGDYTSVQEAAKQLVSIRKIILPNKSNVSLYNEVFDLYNEIKKYTSMLSTGHAKLLKKLESYSSSMIKNL
jgi:sugar (pentulose or hexulose) kinase